MLSPNSKSLPWDEVERKIINEIIWLRNSIDVFSETENNVAINCKECLLRRISILIVSGKIRATEIERNPKLKSFWSDFDKKHYINNNLPQMHHGKEWHKNTMEKIENHFIMQGFKVIREPTLHWGRADLGIFKKMKKIYI